jgi:hypothetical protein
VSTVYPISNYIHKHLQIRATLQEKRREYAYAEAKYSSNLSSVTL